MKIYSFIKNGFDLAPIEVEVTLVPGVPKIHIMGLADTAIKESEMRIKSALKFSGFEMPKGQQILVNLKPAFTKKSSCGLDLAIACAYLWKSGQVPCLSGPGEGVFVYGELGLEGHVTVPDDLGLLCNIEKEITVISGVPKAPLDIDILAMNSLSQLETLQYIARENVAHRRQPPEILKNWSFPKEAAEALCVAATGEHSLLLAGPAGSGKSTLAEALYLLLEDVEEQSFREAAFINRALGREIKWRPFVHPHHTTPVISMLGGGHPIAPGEISRAHSGLLFLDEFLEFKPEVKEALREPMETGSISVARRGRHTQFPASFMLVGATNLCPCGDLVPGRPSQCRFSLRRCQSYLEKLSGPLLDRFQMFIFSDSWTNQVESSLSELKLKVQQGHNFRVKTRKQDFPNSRLQLEQIKVSCPAEILANIMPGPGRSRRRKLAILRVARTFADLDESVELKLNHINNAIVWSYRNFEKVTRLCQ